MSKKLPYNQRHPERQATGNLAPRPDRAYGPAVVGFAIFLAVLLLALTWSLGSDDSIGTASSGSDTAPLSVEQGGDLNDAAGASGDLLQGTAQGSLDGSSANRLQQPGSIDNGQASGVDVLDQVEQGPLEITP